MQSARRAVRRVGGHLVRRLGLLPSGEPDGIGDSPELLERRPDLTVLVFFGDTVRNLYQLRQWYGVLDELNRRHPVGIVCLDSRVARTLRAETALPVVCCGRIAVIEKLFARSTAQLALYVNHDVRNLSVTRFTDLLHVYLGHGESDKAASSSNQVKAYDFVLVAGAAGRDRLQRALLWYDVDRHVRTIGRPQLDVGAPPAVARASAGARPRIVYAPTWEGAQPSMAYSSVRSHGETLVSALLDSDEFDLTYRPHPRLGANDASFADADVRLAGLVRAADGGAGRHRVDTATTWDPRSAEGDLLITDISAVAADWMTTGRPIVVTVPASPDAFVDAHSVLDVVPVLSAGDAPKVVELARSALVDGDVAARADWIRYTMGDLTPGRSLGRFLTLCDELLAIRNAEVTARSGRGGDVG